MDRNKRYFEGFEARVIPGFSRYFATADGRLFSTNYKNSGKTKVLKPALNPTGYPCTMLQSDEKKYVSKPIHYFITLAFFGLRENKEDVNHIDCNKLNNAITNLEYISHAENIQHAFDNELMIPKRGELNGHSKLTETDVLAIRERANCGKRFYGRKELALQYGVSEAHIKDIVSRRRDVWGHI